MKLNANKMLVSSFRAKFHCEIRDVTVHLGRSFAEVLASENRDIESSSIRTVGVIAPRGTGKSAFLSGIHDGLCDDFNQQSSMATLMQKGVYNTISEKGGLIRHFDLCVSPDNKDFSYSYIPPHHKLLAQGLDEAGVELVEHANIYRSARFDYIFRLRALGRDSRTLSVYTSDELAAEPAFQKFLDDNQIRRAKPKHYMMDMIDAMCPDINAWMPMN